MHLRGTQLLDDFIRTHSGCRAPITAWRNEVGEARWLNSDDLDLSGLVARYGEAANSVLFTIVPKLCLVQTSISFSHGLVLVTHAWSDDGRTPRRRRVIN